jgi:superfamily II DNA or RNA helicase
MLRRHVGSKYVAAVTGKTTTSLRKKIIAGFRAGAIRVVAGTVLGEGVDIPELDVVINGEGGRGYVPTMQRLRCLTPHPGKTRGILVDFMDNHHPQLSTSTEERMAIYSSEPSFRFRYEVDPV